MSFWGELINRKLEFFFINCLFSDKNDEIDFSSQRNASPTTAAAAAAVAAAAAAAASVASPSVPTPAAAPSTAAAAAKPAKVVVEVTEDQQAEAAEDEDKLMGKISFNAKQQQPGSSSSMEITGLSSLAKDEQELTKVLGSKKHESDETNFHICGKKIQIPFYLPLE